VHDYDAIAGAYAQAFAERQPGDRRVLHDFGQLVDVSAPA
jgi:hypothetical protein